VIAMSENQFTPSIDADARRAALEVIATLVNVKRIAADLVLRPVGIPDDLIHRFLRERDPITHDLVTQSGALILDELARESEDRPVIRKLVELAAGWDGFQHRGRQRAKCAVERARKMRPVIFEH
jgi:hypothetical protein